MLTHEGDDIWSMGIMEVERILLKELAENEGHACPTGVFYDWLRDFIISSTTYETRWNGKEIKISPENIVSWLEVAIDQYKDQHPEIEFVEYPTVPPPIN